MLNCVDYIYFLEEISYKNKVKFLKAKSILLIKDFL